MASRKGIHISGHYVISINATVPGMPFHIRTLNSKKMKGRTESYFVLFYGILVSGYVKFIPTAVSSN